MNDVKLTANPVEQPQQEQQQQQHEEQPQQNHNANNTEHLVPLIQSGTRVWVKIKVHSERQIQENTEEKLEQLLNNTQFFKYNYEKRSCVDDVFIDVLKDCKITPIFSNMFALKNSATNFYVKLSATLDELAVSQLTGIIELELRIRHAFTSEHETKNGRVQECDRYHIGERSCWMSVGRTVISSCFVCGV